MNATFKKKLLPVILLIVLIGLYPAYRYTESMINRTSVFADIAQTFDNDSQEMRISVTPDNDGTAKQVSYSIQDTNSEYRKKKTHTFTGNEIHVQIMTIFLSQFKIDGIEFDNDSAVHLFLRLFLLEGESSQIHTISRLNRIPAGHDIADVENRYEETFWQHLWDYALDPYNEHTIYVTNAQLPVAENLPVTYTIRIDAHGNISIASQEESP